MARYKPIVRDGILLPVILAEQIQPVTFEFALDHLIDARDHTPRSRV